MSRFVRMLGLSVAGLVLNADLVTKAVMCSARMQAISLIDVLPFFDLPLGLNRGISYGLFSSRSVWLL